MKRFFYKILFFLPLPFLVITINYFIDPAHVFSDGTYESGIAQLLLSGSNVAAISNYDERVLQKYIIEKLPRKKDVVILGSSRVMQIGSDNLYNESVLNNGVSGASLEDLMAIYEIHREKGFKPSMIYMGLDPWLLNRNSGQFRYQSIYREYQNIVLGLIPRREEQSSVVQGYNEGVVVSGILKSQVKKYYQLISPGYFRESFKELLRSNRRSYYPTNNELEEEMVKLQDGSVNYGKDFRNVDIVSTRRNASKYTEKPVYSLEKFDGMDDVYRKMFEDFIKLITKDGIKVVFILVPYHPLSYSKMLGSERYSIIGDVEKYFKHIAKDKGIQIVGSYDPSKCSLDENYFYDGMHPKRTAVPRILACVPERLEDEE